MQAFLRTSTFGAKKEMERKRNYSIVVISLLIIVCIFFPVSPAEALIVGIVCGALGWTFQPLASKSTVLLKWAIVLMGFGMQLTEVLTIGVNGLPYTFAFVILTFLIGFALNKILKVEGKTALLIIGGTAICGGSAIAALSPILKAKEKQVSIALILVFLLNAMALFIFPFIGNHLGMSQTAFGEWAAIAIHDTSSVVGASETYGKEALRVGVSLKLLRTLFIIPISMLVAIYYNKNENHITGKMKVPWFIIGFIVSLMLANLIPHFTPIGNALFDAGRKGLIIALLLLGSMINFKELMKASWKSFALAIILWLIIGSLSLFILK